VDGVGQGRGGGAWGLHRRTGVWDGWE
jgi:hypothetical protein